MIRHPAVLMYLPSPRGFFGISDSGKLYRTFSFGGACVDASGADAPVVWFGAEDIRRRVLVAKYGRGKCRESESKRAAALTFDDMGRQVSG